MSEIDSRDVIKLEKDMKKYRILNNEKNLEISLLKESLKGSEILTDTLLKYNGDMEDEIKQLKDTNQQFHDRYMESCKKRDSLKKELKEITASCDLWFNDTKKLKQKLEKINLITFGENDEVSKLIQKELESK